MKPLLCLTAVLTVVLELGAGVAVAGEVAGRESLLQMMALRPKDPWPRGVGHVVLATPGTPEDWKGYHEPGGSFSPAFGSFGLSFWVVDERDRLLTTSDALPLDQIQQRWVWPEKAAWPARPDLPGIETRTPYYVSTWSVLDATHSQLHLQLRGTNALWIMVRSPGPAGAPLKALQFSGGRLFVSDRWSLGLRGRGADLEVAPPGAADPGTVRAPRYFWPAEQPWGYARYKLLPTQEYWLTVEDSVAPTENPLPASRGRASVKLTLPEPRFAECLNAQVAQLLTGLVRNETRPGDPNNYPLNWVRDGAYVIAALARAGQLEVARELCGPFAEKDFFGGFGAEADAPGLALWALDEVSVRLRSREFDAWLWPHVQRKTQLIEAMAAATAPIRQAYTGPIVPAHAADADLDRVCGPARDGLIVGRMDGHEPLLFVNAVSVRGLDGAAALADRTQHPEVAARWRGLAGNLRAAWGRALATAEARNERSAVCGLHPTWVATDRTAYATALEARWQQTHDAQGRLKSVPAWTYFTLGEAHQWLVLGRPERVWNDLSWFWEHQASPGLFTWWEGTGEENTFGRWNRVRGWTKPAHVTPHYWTAAEMVLLQLDMLAFVDEGEGQPTLVVGAGVPKDWLAQPLEVEGLSTRLGPVDWDWSPKGAGRLTVRLNGAKLHVKAGPSFPAAAALRVKP